MAHSPDDGRRLLAGARHAGLRLDTFVAQTLGIGRRAAARLVSRARVNGRWAVKGSLLAVGDEIRLPEAEADSDELVAAPEILRTDPGVIVLIKPVDLPSVAIAGSSVPSAAAWLARHRPGSASIGPAGEAGLVHRLDTRTSGLLLAARSSEAYLGLRAQFRDHSIEKTYLALVAGVIDTAFTIDVPIGQHKKSRTRVRPLSGDTHPRYHVTPAETRVRPIDTAGGDTLVEAHTHTGARHQIRAHLSHVGHPLVADQRYGGPGRAPLAGHLLHASKLSWIDPLDGSARTAQSEPPLWWREAILRSCGEDLLRHHANEP